MDEWTVIYIFKISEDYQVEKPKIFHVTMLINEEIVSFPHYLLVNQFDVDGFEWISKIMMVYG